MSKSKKIVLQINEGNLQISTLDTGTSATQLAFELPVTSLATDKSGVDFARLAQAIAEHLYLIFPDDFAPIPLHSAQTTDDLQGYDIAHQLIHKSVVERNGVYVPVIDHLIRQAAAQDACAKDFLENSWSVISDRLRSYPVSSSN